MQNEHINTRVLVIDDEEFVRDNIEDILVPRRVQKNEMITQASNILFDDEDDAKILLPANNNDIPVFTVDKAINGMDGLEKVKQSVAANKPYAVIFLDMRMPGWDGLETALHIREVDTKAEIIIITAYSDRSIEEIVAKAGQNVGYHCKPYSAEEILQLATKAVADYAKLRNLEKLINIISSINVSKTHLDSLLQNILDQLAVYVGTDMAVLGKLLHNKEYQKLFSIGAVEKSVNVNRLSSIIAGITFRPEEVVQVNELVFVKLEDYIIFAVLDTQQQLKTEKLYLLKLFMQSAAKAIKNLQLYEELVQKERLSAVGKAVSMLVHDLRAPIKNISMLTGMIREEGYNSSLLEMVDACGGQASEIFDDFMDFIRETPLHINPVLVDTLIRAGVSLANERSDMKDITVHLNIQPELVIPADGNKLKRVIMNLVNNAVDALKDHKTAAPQITIDARQNGNVATITIKDNGPGIPDKVMANMFDAFVTVNKTNGTGLGLTIAKQYIHAHNGTIEVVNNNGAVFTITLPT